jgi:hypothetical protein
MELVTTTTFDFNPLEELVPMCKQGTAFWQVERFTARRFQM